MQNFYKTIDLHIKWYYVLLHIAIYNNNSILFKCFFVDKRITKAICTLVSRKIVFCRDHSGLKIKTYLLVLLTETSLNRSLVNWGSTV